MSFIPRIERSLISHYFKGYWENVENHRAALQALMKRGHVETGISGSNLVWDARVSRYVSASYAEGETIDVTRSNQYIQCNLPWAFNYVTDGITRDEAAMANGEWAILRHQKEMLQNMTTDFEERMNSAFLTVDGPASTGNVWYGLPSFLAAAGGTAAGDKEAVASDTYAGQSTALSGLTGVDSPDADAWTPTLVNWSSTAWAATGITWIDNCLQVLTYTKDQITFGNKQELQPDLVILTRDMLSDLKYAITSQQRMVITVKPGSDGPSGLGIPGAVEHDGLEVVFDTDQTANTGHMLNFNQIWLECLPTPGIDNPGPKLGGKGNKPEYFEVLTQDDIRSNGIIARVNNRSQFRFNPRYQAKMFNYA